MRVAAALVAVAATVVSSPQVTSVRLPANLNLYSLAPVGGSLLLTGDTVAGGHCASVRVEQVSLRITAHGTTSCSSVPAEPVYPVLDYDPKNFTVSVRIARVDPRTHRVTQRPIVMSFQQYSDTHLETAYGPGTLWLFDTDTTKGPEVIQVATKTGRVQNVVSMPRIFRPTLAADSDGLWLAIATNGDAGPGPSPIYHIALDAHAPVLVHRGGRAALWIVAAGHIVVADVLSGRSHGELWRFHGGSGRGSALAPANDLNSWATSFSTDRASIWTVREVPTDDKYFECDSLQVIRINATTGAQSIMTTVPTQDSQCYGVTYSTVAGDAFLFLYGPKLYRVT